MKNKTYSTPGSRLKAELKVRGLTQKQFAKEVSLMPSLVSEIISNKRSISTTVAMKLQDFLNIPATEWLDMQTKYKLANKEGAGEMEAVDELSCIDEYVSIKTLLSRSDSVAPKTNCEKLLFLKQEYGVTSSRQLQGYCGFFKKSEKTGLDIRMLLTWMLIAQRDARQCPVAGKFNKGDLNVVASELCRVFHNNENTTLLTSNVLSKYGIKFCVTQKVDRASVDGFSFKDNGVPTIVVTKRFNRIDNFAFSVMHELFHVYNHLSGSEDRYISAEGYLLETKKEEEQANRFALDVLIPPEVWATAPDVKPVPNIIQKRYSRWARENNLNVWIVLGRIAHDLGLYQMSTNVSRVTS